MSFRQISKVKRQPITIYPEQENEINQTNGNKQDDNEVKKISSCFLVSNFELSVASYVSKPKNKSILDKFSSNPHTYTSKD